MESKRPKPSPALARRLVFSGRVQGVGFRYTAREAARRQRLTGFVRNLADGDVEALVQGSADDIDRFLAELKQRFHGFIVNIDISPTAVEPSRRDFSIAF